jgi:hypothetical protein
VKYAPRSCGIESKPHIGVVDELRFAGEIDVVGAGRRARGDERLAVQDVRTNRRDHDARALGDVAYGGRIVDVGYQQGDVTQHRIDLGETIAHTFEFGLVASGEGPPKTWRRVAREVFGGQLAGESGCAEHDHVVRPVGAVVRGAGWHAQAPCLWRSVWHWPASGTTPPSLTGCPRAAGLTEGEMAMRIGGSLFLIAIGAVLKFAVSKHVNGVDLQMIGVILMVIGLVGLVITLVWMSTRRRTDVISRPGATTYVTPHEPIDY